MRIFPSSSSRPCWKADTANKARAGLLLMIAVLQSMACASEGLAEAVSARQREPLPVAPAGTYRSTLKPGQPVQATLSGDYTRITITGSVNQTITPESMHMDRYADQRTHTLNEVTDERQDSVALDIIELNLDFNGDGYNDLSVLSTHGTGGENYQYFLYDPRLKKYVHHVDLSEIPFLYFDKDRRQLMNMVDDGEDGHTESVYKVDAKEKAYLAENHECKAIREAGTHALLGYVREDRVYSADGNMMSTTRKQFPTQLPASKGQPRCG